MNDDEMDVVPDGELVKWDKVGTVIFGVLKSHRQQPTGKGMGQLYEVKTGRGVEAFFATSILHKKLSEVKMGSVVKITFEKESRTHTGNTLKHFQVASVKPGDPRYANLLAKAGIDEMDSVDGADEFATIGDNNDKPF